MERRAFVQGAFGLVSLVAFGAAGLGTACKAAPEFVTSVAADVQGARGPVMMAGVELAQAGDAVQGSYKGTHLFDVDATGAELIRLADGSLSIDEIADSASVPLKTADVASFFVELGQAGYLANTVLVNLTETYA